MKSLVDMIHQAMFSITKKGYNPREVDAFIEELKDECVRWEQEYKKLQKETEQLREWKAQNSAKLAQNSKRR